MTSSAPYGCAIPALQRALGGHVLTPATTRRLQLRVKRLQQRLDERSSPTAGREMAASAQRVQPAPAPVADAADRIRIIRAGVGNTIRMIPVAEVICFEATEKYVNVVTATGEALVRMSLRELTSRIDVTDFKQVHRGVLVNFNAVVSATRDENGQYSLALRGLSRPLRVSRAFGHLFRPM